MELLEFIYKYGCWISVPLFVVGVASLVFFIRKVIRLQTRMQILSVPLAERQTIEFSEAGRAVLCIEGPLFSRRFARTGFELDAGDGAIIEGRTTRFHARSSGFSKARMEMKVYDIPAPGRYEFRVLNLGAPQPKDREHRIVFMKPHLAQAFAYVIAIVMSSFLCIGSLVLFLLRLVLNETGA